MAQPEIAVQKRLFVRLLFALMLLTAVPLLLLGFYLAHSAQVSIEQTIAERNKRLVERAASEIMSTLRHAQDVLHLNARNPALYRMDRIAQELTINNMVREFDFFRKLAIVDPEGRELASTSYLPVRTAEEDTFVRKAIAGGPKHSGLSISEEGIPLILLSEPVRFRDEVVAFLVAEVTLERMWEVVEQIAVGRQGEAFVFDRSGLLLAHSDRRKVYLGERFSEQEIMDRLRQAPPSSQPPTGGIEASLPAVSLPADSVSPVSFSASAVPVGPAGRTLTYRSVSLGEVLAAYAPLGSTGWTLMIQQPTVEAFAAAHQMRLHILSFLILAIVGASVISYLVARRITRPVSELLEGMEQFSSGDLEFRIRESGAGELRELSRKFNEMAGRILEYERKVRRTARLALLTRVASILSHEIRNPLNAMAINLQALTRELERSGGGRADRVKHYTDIIASEIRRMDQLLGSFLATARPPRLQKRTVDIPALIEEVVQSQLQHAIEQNIRIQTRLPDGPLHAQADEQGLKQVFLNILLNAFQAMPDGGDLSVRVYAADEEARRKKMACVEFRDTGTGIPPEALPQIFDHYFSTRRDGTGLGLAIAHAIVEEHGGKIEVTSAVGQGSVFLVKIPANKEETME